jgi:hypothetical protein
MSMDGGFQAVGAAGENLQIRTLFLFFFNKITHKKKVFL